MIIKSRKIMKIEGGLGLKLVDSFLREGVEVENYKSPIQNSQYAGEPTLTRRKYNRGGNLYGGRGMIKNA